ncbi:MAG: hypothetical protein AB1813_02670 [Verrucomicrobiota bacterium]
MVQTSLWLVLACCAVAFLMQPARASDPVGIYALIDKVVLEPSESAPERVQLWGTFAFAEGKRGASYASPKSGVLYYKLPKDKPDVARKEWSDLKSLAGKIEVVGFASRYQDKGKLRSETEKLKDPEEYPLGWGLTRMTKRDHSYPPVRDLLACIETKGGKKVEKKQ